ncbi:hypothetical protein GCM10010174_55840 [Kutzneria viridogrisea]|uniref:Uncharacterized protein n=1 Tax=Kutzneria viridogrisea TaxID=47990 RepID=A0ABR6BKR8_9PSEU|nr:hypothetical protein [Kutzneria viridogrisea]
MTRALAALALVLGLVGLSATPALAAEEPTYAPVVIVHTEQVQVGPYQVAVGFGDWPLRSLRSLDFTFDPDGGIADKTGTLVINQDGGAAVRGKPLSRHPRKLDSWGLDVFSLKGEGNWTFTFHLDGPKGPGEGKLNLTVLTAPGPPIAVSWVIGGLPLLAVAGAVFLVWRRARPGRLQGTWAW